MFKQLNAKVDLAFVSPIKGKEVETMDEIGQTVKPLNWLILREDSHEHSRKQKKVSNRREVGPESY